MTLPLFGDRSFSALVAGMYILYLAGLLNQEFSPECQQYITTYPLNTQHIDKETCTLNMITAEISARATRTGLRSVFDSMGVQQDDRLVDSLVENRKKHNRAVRRKEFEVQDDSKQYHWEVNTAASQSSRSSTRTGPFEFGIAYAADAAGNQINFNGIQSLKISKPLKNCSDMASQIRSGYSKFEPDPDIPGKDRWVSGSEQNSAARELRRQGLEEDLVKDAQADLSSGSEVDNGNTADDSSSIKSISAITTCRTFITPDSGEFALALTDNTGLSVY